MTRSAAPTPCTTNFVRQVERVAKSSAAKLVNAARLEAKMEVSSAKGDGVDDGVRDRAWPLETLRSAEYDRLFDALAAEALADASGDVDHPRGSRRCGAGAEGRCRAAVSPPQVVGDLDSAGGLVVELFGGRIVRRNTLEDRLDRVSQIVQADVARVLFS